MKEKTKKYLIWGEYEGDSPIWNNIPYKYTWDESLLDSVSCCDGWGRGPTGEEDCEFALLDEAVAYRREPEDETAWEAVVFRVVECTEKQLSCLLTDMNGGGYSYMQYFSSKINEEDMKKIVEGE